MQTTQRVLFVIAFVVLCIHAIRLTYDKWLEPRQSVLDAYEETLDAEIREAESLDELRDRYDEAHEAVKAYEADETNPQIEQYERARTEPYRTERRLRAAITEWEAKSKIISKVRRYWMCGLVFLFTGWALHRWVSPWLGLAALIVAFSEMIYWSSPPYLGEMSQEYERLLTNKLMLAWVSLVLLVAAGRVIGIWGRGKAT